MVGREMGKVPFRVQHKLKFSIASKNIFTLFISKIKKLQFLQLQLVEYDSFNESIVS
jgi:hypothetical protein